MEVSETVSKFIRHSFDIGYVDINLDHHDSRWSQAVIFKGGVCELSTPYNLDTHPTKEDMKQT